MRVEAGTPGFSRSLRRRAAGDPRVWLAATAKAVRTYQCASALGPHDPGCPCLLLQGCRKVSLLRQTIGGRRRGDGGSEPRGPGRAASVLLPCRRRTHERRDLEGTPKRRTHAPNHRTARVGRGGSSASAPFRSALGCIGLSSFGFDLLSCRAVPRSREPWPPVPSFEARRSPLGVLLRRAGIERTGR